MARFGLGLDLGNLKCPLRGSSDESHVMYVFDKFSQHVAHEVKS